MSKKEEKEYEEYESLKNSKFKQQKLPGWRPVPSMLRTIIIYFGFGIVFVGLGVLILLFSNDIVEYPFEYCEKVDNEGNCNIEFTINKTMKPNIMVYYQIDGFYQNHRRYMKSRSEKQLKGDDITEKEAEVCEPARTNGEMGKVDSIVRDNNNDPLQLESKDIAYPCGLMAKSFFNDSFTFKWKNNGSVITVNKTNIARKSDKEKYKNNKNKTKQWIDIEENEDFLVWMRPSPLPNFRKLWGRIEEKLEKDAEIIVEVKNNYDVSLLFSPNATKHLIISTVNSFGGKNPFLAIGCLILGGASLILGVIFLIGFKMRAKKEK